MMMVIRYCYAPFFFIGFIGIAIYLVAIQLHKLWLLPVLGAAILVSFACERLLPYERRWNDSKDDARRDSIHAVVNESFNIMAVGLIPALVLWFPHYDLWPHDWSLLNQLILAILIADCGITLVHYFSHKIEILWRFHAIHHSVERLYGFNGLMKHPIHQAIELLAGTAPLVLIGLPLEIGALLAFSVAIELLLQHSNVDIKLGKFAYFWAIAPGHRHHHVASKVNGDVNFGLFMMFWDHLLGTFEIARRQPNHGDLGIEASPDFPKNYASQLKYPFFRS